MVARERCECKLEGGERKKEWKGEIKEEDDFVKVNLAKFAPVLLLSDETYQMSGNHLHLL